MLKKKKKKKERAPIEHLMIGEESGQWKWEVLIFVLSNFTSLRHLRVDIGGFETSLPVFEHKSDFNMFVETCRQVIPSLHSLWCIDDALLRILLILANYRIRDTSLKYVRYNVQFSPLTLLTGIEFSGVSVLEIAPWDSMLLNVPSSIVSLRLSGNHEFTEVEDWTMLLNYSNHIHELCLHRIENIANLRGLRTLSKLKYLVIRTPPKSIKVLIDTVYALSFYSPLQFVSLVLDSSEILTFNPLSINQSSAINNHYISNAINSTSHPLSVSTHTCSNRKGLPLQKSQTGNLHSLRNRNQQRFNAKFQNLKQINVQHIKEKQHKLNDHPTIVHVFFNSYCQPTFMHSNSVKSPVSVDKSDLIFSDFNF